VNLTPLHERGVAKHHPYRLVQRIRAIENHQQAAGGAQAATLQI
jgi:hypothetical protein